MPEGNVASYAGSPSSMAGQDDSSAGRPDPLAGDIGHGFFYPNHKFHGVVSSPGRLEADDRLIFLHFEKTAGSTVRNCLARVFDKGALCPERGEKFAIWPEEWIRQYRFFSSHSRLKDFRFVPQPVKLITFLRNPIERSISLFQYWASYSDAYVSAQNLLHPRLAKNWGIRAMFSEEQADRFGELWNKYTFGLLGDRFLSPSGRPWQSPTEIIDHAIQALDAMAFVGISEDLGTSFSRLSSQLDIPNHYSGQTDNVTKTNHLIDGEHFQAAPEVDLTPELLDVVANANRLDEVIYKYALEKFCGGPIFRREIACVAGLPKACRVRPGYQESWIQVLAGGFVLYGPYMRLLPGRYEVEFRFRCPLTSNGAACETPIGHVDVVALEGDAAIARGELGAELLSQQSATVRLEFCLLRGFNDMQFRVFLQPGSQLETSRNVWLSKL